MFYSDEDEAKPRDVIRMEEVVLAVEFGFFEHVYQQDAEWR